MQSPQPNKPVIYTVGHSNHPIEVFLDLLKTHAVNCLIDVRSVAASSYNPQYNKEPLSNFLKKARITYLHFAEEFGARQTHPDLLDEEDRVNFEPVRQSPAFTAGVERLWVGIDKGFTIALMCSEADPFTCHRFSAISPALEKDGFKVLHILKDKRLQTNAGLESLLLKKYAKALPQPDMFQPNVTAQDQLQATYRLHNKDIGFSPHLKQKLVTAVD